VYNYKVPKFKPSFLTKYQNYSTGFGNAKIKGEGRKFKKTRSICHAIF